MPCTALTSDDAAAPRMAATPLPTPRPTVFHVKQFCCAKSERIHICPCLLNPLLPVNFPLKCVNFGDLGRRSKAQAEALRTVVSD